MTENVAKPVVLRGVVRNLEVVETTVDAFQSEMLRTKTGAAGAIAAAAGLSGIAAGMVAMSMDEMREGAFGVSFEVDGRPVRGVLWNCFFQEGDEVEVVAEDMGDHWNTFAVARPSDRTIALFPHVVSGEVAHYKTSFVVWLKFIGVMMLMGAIVFGVVGPIVGNLTLEGWAFLVFAGGQSLLSCLPSSASTSPASTSRSCALPRVSSPHWAGRT